jgi:UDP-N-acetylmuramyl pentapeptide phosphotransferase/UDP-N-acetylglucosamine-1-phosphate transferase
MSQALFAAPALALLLSTATIVLLRRSAAALPADIPNPRSLHGAPVPRAGGYAVWAGFLPAALAFPPAYPGGLLGWLPAYTAVAIVSAWDDVREVRVASRLFVHAGAAIWAAAWLAHSWPLPYDGTLARAFVTLAVALAIAWSANLYNFMDGNDGLAASMGTIGFAAFAIAHALNADATRASSAPACLALAAAIVPFLAVNRPRASMFLGDVGAVPLGFLAAAFGASGVASGAWPPWFPLLVFLPFIADATLTLVRRAWRGDRLVEGHRGHFYQRLHQLGAGHAGTLAVYVATMLGTAVTALMCRDHAPAAGWWALAAWTAVVCMLFATIDYHWRKKTNIPAQSSRWPSS